MSAMPIIIKNLILPLLISIVILFLLIYHNSDDRDFKHCI